MGVYLTPCPPLPNSRRGGRRPAPGRMQSCESGIRAYTKRFGNKDMLPKAYDGWVFTSPPVPLSQTAGEGEGVPHLVECNHANPVLGRTQKDSATKICYQKRMMDGCLPHPLSPSPKQPERGKASRTLSNAIMRIRY